MIPQGMPAKVCSAFWQRSALSTPLTLEMPHSASRKVDVATLTKQVNMI
jgi:hypothetical protein